MQVTADRERQAEALQTVPGELTGAPETPGLVTTMVRVPRGEMVDHLHVSAPVEQVELAEEHQGLEARTELPVHRVPAVQQEDLGEVQEIREDQEEVAPPVQQVVWVAPELVDHQAV